MEHQVGGRHVPCDGLSFEQDAEILWRRRPIDSVDWTWALASPCSIICVDLHQGEICARA